MTSRPSPAEREKGGLQAIGTIGGRAVSLISLDVASETERALS